MQHDHRHQAMDELASALACIRRASAHLAESGDINCNPDDIASRSLSGVLNASERWCVEGLVEINHRASYTVQATVQEGLPEPVHA